MAINPGTRYPAQTTAPDANYTWGSAKNVAIPGDGTGTPWEKDLVNDLIGFFQEMLTVVSASPSGNPEKVGASQIANAIRSLHAAPTDDMDLGKLINILTAGKITADNPAGENLLVDLPNAGGSRWRAYLRDNGIELWLSSNCSLSGSTWTRDAAGVAFALRMELTAPIGVTLYAQYTTGTPWTAWESEVLSDLGVSTGSPVKAFKTHTGHVEHETRGALSAENAGSASQTLYQRIFIPWGRELVGVITSDCTITTIGSPVRWSALPLIDFVDDFGIVVYGNSDSLTTAQNAYHDFKVVVSK